MSVKTNSPREALSVRERNGLEIIRGDKLLLAIWTVSSRTEKNNTTNDSIAADTMLATARAPSGL